MKKHLIKYGTIVAMVVCFFGCNKEDEMSFADPDIIDVTTIDSISLTPNHTMIVADGKAVLDLRVRAYTKDKIEIYNPRLKDEWFEYTSNQSVPLSRYFSTDDKSLIGKTIMVKVNLKHNKSVVSDEFPFTVIAPLKVEKAYTIPIIFHIIQTTEDIESYGGAFDEVRIQRIIDRLNGVFTGATSVSPTGIDTKITFQAAIYSPNGRKLSQPGINRLVVKEVTYDNPKDKKGYDTFLTDNNLIWPAKDYMNVWLISDRKAPGAFGWNYGYTSAPKFKFANALNSPEGLTLTDVYSDEELSTPRASGVMYKLQSLNLMSKLTGNSNLPGENDLIHYIGAYFGLLKTSWFIESADYCLDTQHYIYTEKSNTALYKKSGNIYFMSENIMDDPTGVHRSVTQNQYSRIQWFLENCPERVAWKSKYALMGK